MNNFTRRRFLQLMSAAPLLSATEPYRRKKKVLLSFSTLGCPDWDYARIVRFAAENHYRGIEIRGIQRQTDLTQRPEFSSAGAIRDTRRRAEDHNVKIINLGSSAALHHTGKAERQKNIDEAKRYIEIASELKCPYIRVFPNNLPKDDSRAAVIELIIQGLQQLGEFARSTGVTVLLESHGDVVYITDLEKIMNDVNSRQVALVWDIANMWSVTREPVSGVYQRLSRFIRHVHIKDAAIQPDGKMRYQLLGRGDIPVGAAIELLYKNGYKGYYSFEWEKLWHPEIEEPEIALADFPVSIKKYFIK
ncbi:MAG: sugar phosphate isomerase/epimerase [Chitinophagaceae bacterium]|nr:sugar phosphate isomerase/epimerase [Chitinophagaceae bacterium]MCW5926389.1 sugar phosphate isomerase/epimerase [Chitinophagaceae bacterium]